MKFYSDRFVVEETSNLSLFLYPSAFVLMAKDEQGSVIAAHQYALGNWNELKQIIATDTLINAANTVGKIYVHNNLFCLVPSVLFDPSARSTYLNFITALDEERQEVFYEGVDSNNIQVVGAVEKELVALLDNALPDLEIAHGAGLLLSYLFRERSEMLGQELFILAERGNMYLAAFASGELKVFNRFPVEGNQDFLKYVFAAIHQLLFDRMHCRVTLIGNPDGIPVDVEFLKQYFKNIRVTVPKFTQTYSPGAEKFQETNLLEAYWNA